MGITYSSIVPAPQAEVFDWHARPGAMTRLTPPWLPVRVLSEARSLRDGRAVLQLPGGIRVVATHDPHAYDPPNAFADRMPGLPVPWHHLHEFADPDAHAGGTANAGGTARTVMTDRVQTPVPGTLLRQMFAYRHRQLADDLAAHRWGRELGASPLTVAVTGSSGLVGTALCAFLTSGGHRVIRLVRRSATSTDERRWNTDDPDPDLLAGVDAVVHLAGVSIAGRFTDAHRRAVRESRIRPTERLAQLVAESRGTMPTFVVASAVGYYGAHRGDEYLTETSERGDDFLADVAADWEAATAAAAQAGARVVNVRTGVVQAAAGGTLRLFRPLFEAGLGGHVGDGSQWLAWIGLDDLVDVYHRALVDPRLVGPVNAVAPIPVRNREFAHTLALVLRRPSLLTVPRFGPRLLLGAEGASELAEADQRAVPGVLNALAHRFRHAELEQALRHQLGRVRLG